MTCWPLVCMKHSTTRITRILPTNAGILVHTPDPPRFRTANADSFQPGYYPHYETQAQAQKPRNRSHPGSLPPEVMDVLLKLKPVFQREFRERFGRELRPDDPVFWSRSRSGDEPVPMTEEEIEQGINEQCAH